MTFVFVGVRHDFHASNSHNFSPLQMGDPPLWAYKVTLEDGYGHTGQLGGTGDRPVKDVVRMTVPDFPSLSLHRAMDLKQVQVQALVEAGRSVERP
jgi:hypothetical protein